MRVDRSRLPALGPLPPFRFPAIRRERLRPGFDVWTVEHREVPVVNCLLLVPVGAAADPAGQEGLAALVGDLLDEGSDGRSAVEVHEAIARIGGQFDTEVGADATLLTLVALSRYASEALGLVAEMSLRPTLADDDVKRVLALRMNRLTQLRDAPAATADRVFTERVFAGHAYGHLAIGTEASLASLTPDDVRRFHAGRFTTAPATLVAVGDSTHDEVIALASALFGDGESAAEEAETECPELEDVNPPPRLLVVDRPGAAQSELRLGLRAPARSTPDYPVLLVLNTILGGQFVSRINLNLREDKGYTYGARTAFDLRREPGAFVAQASVQTDATVAAIREIMRELSDIAGPRPATPEELDLARAALTRGYPRNFETGEQIARALVQLALYGLPDDYFDTFVPSVSSVTAEAVTAAAARYLDPERLIAVVVGDAARIGPDLAKLGLGEPVTVVPNANTGRTVAAPLSSFQS